VDELERNWLEHKILAVFSDNFIIIGDIVTRQRSLSTTLKEAVRGIANVILPDNGHFEAIFTVVVVVATHRVDFELGVRNFKLHVEIYALDPVIVVELAG
jgi:hypothetical protein